MKAIRLFKPGRPLAAEEVPIPVPGSREVLVKVRAAGICHSDAHYRAGRSKVSPLPLTLGHEVAGLVEKAGDQVGHVRVGDRVCVHYLATCGECQYCCEGNEQFCPSGKMMGKYRDGGYAEYLCMPSASVFRLPDEVSFEHGAIMMCSAATSLHALHKARLRAGETVALFGVGGLGFSAVQLAQACGAQTVYAIDIKDTKLELARSFGAIPINALKTNPVLEIQRRTSGKGVDVALELVGLPQTMRQAVEVLGVMGRLALVGISEESFAVSPYHELLNKEAEIIGVSDHLAKEIPALLEWARTGKLRLSHAVTRSIPLDAKSINEVLDDLESYGDSVRVVVTP